MDFTPRCKSHINTSWLNPCNLTENSPFPKKLSGMKDETHTSQEKSIYPVTGQDFVVDIGRFWEEGMK